MINALRKLAGAALALALAAGGAHAQQVLFWSTQARPVEETQKMRDQVLKGFDGPVDYQVAEDGPWLTRLQAELQAGSGAIGLLGGLHGDFSTVGASLVDLSAVDVGGVKVNEAYKKLGMLGTGEQKYMPWMQATFLMAANKQALQYLPPGVDLNTITYDQLIEWSKTIAEKTGSPKFGLPAGPKGLKHRFLEGFLYPSYTGSMVTKFRSPEAETAWSKFKELWQYTNPNSTNYAFMQEPLLSGEVWVAFDHVARLAGAFNQKPDDFVAFPAPAGPAGRGFMPVVAGVAIPKTSPDVGKAKALVAYMLKPETQIATLKATNFFPVVDVKLPDDVPASVKAFAPVITAMTGAPDALPALPPMGLGDLGGKFNQVYSDSFERIVLGGEDVHGVLEEQAAVLKAIIDQAKAPCWAPDKPSEGACPVE
ncbi:ABC transporter substrate-binding protein [Mesorhizobium sp.]|uniref:ABC transporter substrate-binding protein n=1 Tax=Mesorhizobium sp. TaxID=1871066 RepID=UPI000FE38E29|nr:ABC transporter substrate-binding protein [Mesorhizobium sp.]RWG88504.1 MAG: carbohydrate ABC transporter substrate-binding protein [Mesorhizobium sp.]RWG91132.1 MAG: carbohydrate ABC transporter substrate-binding protein [Mesorhizobium sp.]RWK11194.1 MAG: carbohydrate ABC transporter substrate-binding protein [Mesorhizobium sp.]RWK22112.1 MAG: carbohydrate ABC transporter substrate-binding protein [Mesorhizobium sp.]RWK25828.1 MAG: carbohydrate ABC transporter substrate-binding protein [Me